MIKPLLILDLDETLRPFIIPLLNQYNRQYRSNVKLSDIVNYNIHKFLPECNTREAFLSFINNNLKEIYLDPEPYDDVQWTLNKLKEIFELLIVTAAPEKSQEYIKEWIVKYNIGVDIEFESDKTKYNGYCIIDDAPIHLANNSCEHSICISRLYNFGAKSDFRVNNFDVDVLMALEILQRLDRCEDILNLQSIKLHHLEYKYTK